MKARTGCGTSAVCISLGIALATASALAGCRMNTTEPKVGGGEVREPNRHGVARQIIQGEREQLPEENTR